MRQSRSSTIKNFMEDFSDCCSEKQRGVCLLGRGTAPLAALRARRRCLPRVTAGQLPGADQCVVLSMDLHKAANYKPGPVRHGSVSPSRQSDAQVSILRIMPRRSCAQAHTSSAHLSVGSDTLWMDFVAGAL